MTFEDLDTWRQARQMVSDVYRLTRVDALARDYAVSSQLQRAAVSVMSNVAEGFERTHIAEKLQFYNIARASAGEVRSLLYVVEDNFPSSADAAVELRVAAVVVGRVVSGLIRSTEERKTL